MARDCKKCMYFQEMHPNYNDSFACKLDPNCSWIEYKEKKVCKNYEEKLRRKGGEVMSYIFWGFLGAAISYVLTRYYYEKVIDEWRLLYHKCRCEMDRLYKQKDELYKKFKEAQ